MAESAIGRCSCHVEKFTPGRVTLFKCDSLRISILESASIHTPKASWANLHGCI